MSQLISDEDKKIIVENYWSKLDSDVKLIYFNTKRENCKYCTTIEQLYRELTQLSDKISLDTYYYEDQRKLAGKYNVITAPAVVIIGKSKGLIKFYGIPAGMEFPSFIDTIVKISGGNTELDENLITNLNQAVYNYVNIKVFVTPTCPYCPKMVSTAFQFAIINENIDAEAWEAIEFPEESNKYGVKAVPKVIINEEISFEGLVSPEALLHWINKSQDKGAKR